MPEPVIPVEQIERFALAVELLGGQQPAARLLGISAAELEEICIGRLPLDLGLLHAISRALLLHAEACRVMERRLSPAFHENLLPGQQIPRFDEDS